MFLIPPGGLFCEKYLRIQAFPGDGCKLFLRIQRRIFEHGLKKFLKKRAHFPSGLHAHGGEIISGELKLPEACAFSAGFNALKFCPDRAEILSSRLLDE